ncbi:tail assembly chaperone [Viridibacillus sp. FSL E2-0187]|uniref:tail assembly chaperone n=1 Tax=Viridibacillus sp. FSL E2-0187 TaxID=2921362 RepID=UPI0030F5B807
MAFLEIKGEELEGKCTFKFDRVSDEKYNSQDANGNDVGGFSTVYMGLLQYDIKALSQFWDCALSYLASKKKPSIAEIEDALQERIEEDGDALSAFKEAFKAIDNSGFFKLTVKNFWKNLNMVEGMGGTDEEKEQNERYLTTMKEAREELTA